MLLKIFLASAFVLTSLQLRAGVTVDSISVENLNGKKNIVHKVEAKETYYSIARKYNVTPQAIIKFNSNRILQVGTILRVPTDRPFFNEAAQKQKPEKETAKMAVVEYKVGPKEYLLSIARKFNTTVEDLKTLNNLTGNNLAIGQILKIPYGTASQQTISPPVAQLDISGTDSDNSPSQIDSSLNASDRLKLPPARYGLREIDERGLAVWISEPALNANKMLALHQTAPIGTIVKITNPMTGKSTFTKVVGKFTPNESNRDAIIVITKAAADLIGAIDRRFQANIVYGIPHE